MKTSYYITSVDTIAKTFCSLAEKCYYNKNKALVVTGDDLLASSLDQVLWTYSKKHFIPHALSSDPQIDMQPIVIAKTGDASKLPTDFTILLFVNVSRDELLEYLSRVANLSLLSRMIFLCDDAKRVEEIQSILSKSDVQISDIEIFTQNLKGWKNISK